jgi:predicted transcriptional regulator
LINEIDFDGRNTYIITEKGRMFLQEYEKFSDLAGSFGLEL